MPIPSAFLVDFDAFVEAYKYNARGYWLVGWGQDVHYSAICLYLEAIRTCLTSAPLTLDASAILATLSLTSDHYFTTDPQFKYGFIQFLQTYHKKEPSAFILSFDSASSVQLPNFTEMPRFDLIKTLQEAAENIQKNFQGILDSTAVMIEALKRQIIDLTLENKALKDAMPKPERDTLPIGPPPEAPPPPPDFSLPKILRFFKHKDGAETINPSQKKNPVSFFISDGDLNDALRGLRKTEKNPSVKKPRTEDEELRDTLERSLEQMRKHM